MLAGMRLISSREVEDVNHYTIAMGARGAATVADAVHTELAAV